MIFWQKFRQHRQRTKQNSQLYGRQSPIAADHTAITHSPSIPIPMLPKPAVIHGRCSMEGLNSEIQNLVVTDGDDSVFKAPVSIELLDEARCFGTLIRQYLIVPAIAEFF